MFKIRMFGICLMLLTTLAYNAKATLTLASGGQTNYNVVSPANPSQLEQEAIQDLKDFLEEITGADFDQTGKPYHIYVGTPAPQFFQQLEESERRIKSVSNDIYIWGKDKSSSAFAVYDFLDNFLHCRWYSITNMYIPSTSNLTLADIDYALIPSFSSISLYGGNWFCDISDAVKDFARRSRCHLRDGAYDLIGPTGPHTAMDIIPPEDYFATHPEYFAMNYLGNRISNGQLCYSNTGMKNTYIQNLDTIISNEYTSGPARIYVDLCDNERYCHCPQCQALQTQYGTSAGAYFDFLINDVCTHFQTYYPDITIIGMAYWSSEEPPVNITQLPDNLYIRFSPLWSNYLKPYDDSSNQDAYDWLDGWTDKCDKVILQIYPTTYPSWVIAHPLCANIQRLCDNIRIAEDEGVRELIGEVGYYFYSTVGFNELRMFLITQLAQDVNRDEDALIQEFMTHHYGAAASTMTQYYNALELCEANETNILRWNPQFETALEYLTPTNLLAWESMFDSMEQLVANDSRSLLNVRRVRVELDEAVMTVFDKFIPPQVPDAAAIMSRYTQTVDDDTEDLISDITDPELYDDANSTLKAMWPLGMKSQYALVTGGTALPAPFDQMNPNNIIRIIPHCGNNLRKHEYPGPAFGFTMRGPWPNSDFTIDKIVVCPQDETLGNIVHLINPQVVKLEDITNSAGPGYDTFYHLGSSRLWPDCYLVVSHIFPGGRIYLGRHYDATRPDAEYQIYAFIKYATWDNDEPLWLDQLVLVKGNDATTSQPVTSTGIR